MATVLITGGRAPVALELARQFQAVGHRVLVADSFEQQLCRVSRAVAKSFLLPPPNQKTDAFGQALARIAAEEGVELLIPTCEEVFFVSRVKDLLPKRCEVFVDEPPKLAQLHDKWRFNQLAVELGLPVPRSVRLESEADGARIPSDWPGLVLKPVFSRFAARAHLFPNGRPPSLPALGIHPTSRAPWIAQERVAGRELCTYSVARAGALTAHAAYLPDFRAGKGAGISFAAIDHAPARRWVEALVAALRFTGQIAFDFIERDGEVLALECNPRATSGAHLFEPEDRLDRAFLAPGTFVEPKSTRPRMVAAALALYGPGAVRSVGRLRALLRTFWDGRDVVFRWNDWRPFLYQFVGLFGFWRLSRAHDISLLAASTWDIEWNGEP